MREIRTYIDARLTEGEALTLDERAAGHVVRVLRRRVGDLITLFDGRGIEAAAELIAIERRGPCRVRIVGVAAIDRESPLRIELVQAVARGEKMDWIVQKATELGVTSIRPVFTERSEVRAEGQALLRKQARWQEIAIGACEQSGRNVLPLIHAPVALVELATEAELRLMLDPDGATALAGVVSGATGKSGQTSIALAIGPEGGLGDQDRALLRRSGYAAVTLGPRVLRTETAGPAAIAVLQVLQGDFAGDRPEEARS
jgi:16S rRNA (uracil1498-N3)-methyltransferase